MAPSRRLPAGSYGAHTAPLHLLSSPWWRGGIPRAAHACAPLTTLTVTWRGHTYIPRALRHLSGRPVDSFDISFVHQMKTVPLYCLNLTATVAPTLAGTTHTLKHLICTARAYLTASPTPHLRARLRHLPPSQLTHPAPSLPTLPHTAAPSMAIWHHCFTTAPTSHALVSLWLNLYHGHPNLSVFSLDCGPPDWRTCRA